MASSSKLLSAMVRAAAHAALEQYRRAAGPAVHPPPSERTLRAAHEQGRRPDNELTVKGLPSKGDPSTGRASLLLGHSDVTVCYVRFPRRPEPPLPCFSPSGQRWRIWPVDDRTITFPRDSTYTGGPEALRGKAAGARGHWPYASQVFALPPHRIRGGAPVSRRLRDGSSHPPILRDVAKRDGVEASSIRPMI